MDVSTNYFNNTLNTSNLGTTAIDVLNLISTPKFIIILLIIIGIYAIVIMNLGSDDTFKNMNSSFESFSSSSTSSTSSTIITVFFLVLILLILTNGIQYIFGIDILARIKNLFTLNPEVDIKVDETRKDAINAPVPEILLRKQVFNIPGNDYVYQDAKALCSAYGARLATYKEVEESYIDGGEWCNYGWSDGQMALFPTQQKTFDELQKIEGHENDCGRPGVNGGYMANPMVKYGVNCYGYKPRMTPQEEDLMAMKQIYPKTEKDIAMENRVNYWKDKLSEVLVSPFNHNSWSRL
jgi:hypothetical protein